MWYVDAIGLIKTPRGITITTSIPVEQRVGDGNGTGVFDNVDDQVQYPRSIFTQWTPAELAAIGIKPASITAVDSRYKNTGELTWDTSGDEAVGTYATSDVSLADIKTQVKQSVNSTASTMLAQSDWMVIRESDGGTAVPADWKTYRAALRTTANAKETEVDALADVDAVKAWQAHPVTYTLSSGTHDTTVDLATWTEEGNHTKSWPLAPDHIADSNFVSVADT